MKYSFVIFDFDGTIADSFPWLLNVLDEVADQYQMKHLDRADLELVRGLDPRRLMQTYKVPFWRLPAIGATIRSNMSRDIGQIRLFEGMDQVVRGLASAGVTLAMLTSNACANVRQVLGEEIAALFDFYECDVDVFGKPARIRRLLKASGLPAGQTLMIGDELRDLEAARRAGIAAGAVAWGYARFDVLAARRPAELFQSVAEILPRLT